MGVDVRHLYTLEIRASRDVAGCYTWAIRERGKLFRRSDRPHASEEQARAVAEAEMERLLRAP